MLKPCGNVACFYFLKDEPGAKVIVVEGESDKTEEATTPTDVNVRYFRAWKDIFDCNVLHI